jgi:hypothetical protein
MPVPAGSLRRYAAAWTFLVVFVIFQIGYALLSPAAQASFTAWASTSVVNLEHDPVGCLVVSAFITGGSALAWPLLIALAVFGANRALGNTRTAVICVAGHVIGSLVSEGIIAYRVDAGQLPVSFRHLTDVGPSYVVMSAIIVALLAGGWIARAAAALDLVLLVFVGDIFSGLSHLEVAAVGHLVAAVTAAAGVGIVWAWRARQPPAVATADGAAPGPAFLPKNRYMHHFAFSPGRAGRPLGRSGRAGTGQSNRAGWSPRRSRPIFACSRLVDCARRRHRPPALRRNTRDVPLVLRHRPASGTTWNLRA